MGLQERLTIALCLVASISSVAAGDELSIDAKTHDTTSTYQYYPDPTVVTFKTKTSVRTSVVTVTPATVTVVQKPDPTTPAPLAKVTGCDNLFGCSACEPGTSCMIGDLPGECIQDCWGLASLEVSDPGHRRACDQTLLTLTRQERKAWAVSITPHNCLPLNDFDVPGYARLVGKECAEPIGDLSHEELSAWISGFLPLRCPWPGYNNTEDYAYYSQQAHGSSPTGEHFHFPGQDEEEWRVCKDVFDTMLKNLPKRKDWSTTGMCNRDGCAQAFAEDAGVRVGQGSVGQSGGSGSRDQLIDVAKEMLPGSVEHSQLQPPDSDDGQSCRAR